MSKERDLVFITDSSKFFDKETSTSYSGLSSIFESATLWNTHKGAWVLETRVPTMVSTVFGQDSQECHYELLDQSEAIQWLIRNKHYPEITEDFLRNNEV